MPATGNSGVTDPVNKLNKATATGWGMGVAGVLTALALVGCAMGEAPHEAAHAPHWAYTGAEGPTHWAELGPDYAMCSTGTEQSPIDLQPSGIKFMKADWLVPLAVKFGPSKLHVVNNGHTIQLNYDRGTTFSFEKRSYRLLQFHFHAPSEHTLNGQAAAMEMHMVFGTNKTPPDLAVIGFWLVEGAENPFFAKFWHVLPEKSGEKAEKEIDLNVGDAVPANRQYWHYDGSLTTPPCGQGVKWFVLKGTSTVSRTQLDKFNGLFAGGPTNRPTMPLYDRIVKDAAGTTPGVAVAAAAH